MKILALEFSSPQRSVAVVHAEGDGASPATSEVVESGTRESHAFALIEEALRQARLEREQIECLAVGLGPGSYTGIRAAIAIAQGWQLARETKILGISSVECLAAQAQAAGIAGKVGIVIDAQRNEFYFGEYDLSAGARQNLQPLHLVDLAALQAWQPDGLLIGPEVVKWFPSARMIFPTAAMLGRLALRRNDFVAGETVEPIYLRETNFVKAAPPRVLLA